MKNRTKDEWYYTPKQILEIITKSGDFPFGEYQLLYTETLNTFTVRKVQ